ncbi:hypothetical protein DM01DRAFT_1339214 [Hesseltinella vesiculosa]|uniref:AN1-type domain-containing protein n=1 Tax=Hesseltinella vesiculosa TaxID=101127 RepID=A0A1X2G7S0_9FUNG|nr:hypothetical protein DM01DRAFT_1339214 [Hesseltinella vesiculosa]
MELLDIGKHCTFNGCAQLDFLPYTCFHCKMIFCQEHFKLDDHQCPGRNDPSLDVRVPTCPICDQPVPGARSEDPNIRVNRHIQNNCAQESKPSNLCKQKACKAKLLVPMTCPACGDHFCVKHRLEQDHQCQGRTSKQPKKRASNASLQRKAGLAALLRQKKPHHDPSPSSQLKQSSSNKQQHQQLLHLQAKASRGALSEQEQIELATLLSLEQHHKDNKHCMIS